MAVNVSRGRGRSNRSRATEVSPPPEMDLDVPQIVTINQVPPSSEPDFEEEYATEEEEIDEIIDDDLPQPPPTRPKANGKAKAKATPNNATPNVTPPPAEPPQPSPEPQIPPLPPRKLGESHVDLKRMEKIMKSHGDILPPAKDAIFIVGLAVEEFIKQLALTASKHAEEAHRKTITQNDMALAAQSDPGFSFLRETVSIPIPLSIALQRRAEKETERTLIATELVHPPSAALGNGATTHVQKKRQPPLPKPAAPPKNKIRTSARQANGRTSAVASGSASAPAPSTRPKRAAAQKGRESWAHAEDDDDQEFEKEGTPELLVEKEDEDEATEMDVDMNGAEWKASRPTAGNGRAGLMKGFGPGAYSKVGGVIVGGPSTRPVSAATAGASPPRSRSSWGFAAEPPRNMGRTIYSDRTDEEARKAAVEAEEQLRYNRTRRKFDLMDQDEPEGETADR
ncbi:hypothetical protein M422DRAFT_41858 [Sphaerobolus stellatus SS14]|nr:hypothetical protein M422DRAFT_41858 [Sphaerobolus stellatus SS14]